MKKFLVFLLVFVIIGLAGFFVLQKRKADLAQATPAPILPAVVATMDLKTEPVTLTLPAMGIVASDVSAVLSTRISGRVLEVFRQEGDVVKKGERLAEIDAAELQAKMQGLVSRRQGIVFQVEAKQAEIAALEMGVKNALEVHARTKELLDINGASAEQFSGEEAEIAMLQAKLTAARNDIGVLRKSIETVGASIREIDSLREYAVVRAPVDGTVSEVFVSPGDLASPGKPLLSIASGTGLYLELSLPGSVPAVNITLKGETLPLTSRAQTGTTGLVQYVAPLPENAGVIEGQRVTVHVVIYTGKNELLPFDALLTTNSSSSVFVLTSDGKAQRLNVTITARGVEGAVVEQNLAGRRIILAKPDILLRVSAGVPVIVDNV